MKLNARQYGKLLKEHNISVIYSGPIWSGGIDGIAEMLLKRFEHEDLSPSASQSVFSVFVEQMNNMLMYSAEKEYQINSNGVETETSKGIFILGVEDKVCFIQTGNAVTLRNAEILKSRIDYLNTLDKKELRRYHKQQLNADNDNPESKGAGVGLIEIARRASSPIEYEFEPFENGLQYFNMYVIMQ